MLEPGDLPAFDVEVPLRLGAALLTGGLIGLERELQGKAAGLRTHMMVALGAAIFTVTTFQIFDELSRDTSDAARLDPLRLVQGLVSGMGFLGAGAIVRAGGSIEGLTTAAGLWAVGALGMACGAGQYPLAATGVVMALVVLVVVGILEKRFSERRERSDGV